MGVAGAARKDIMGLATRSRLRLRGAGARRAAARRYGAFVGLGPATWRPTSGVWVASLTGTGLGVAH